MPDGVNVTYRARLGIHRGLEAGIIPHPPGGTEIYLDGVVRCREQLMRDHLGPRAVLNALEPLSDAYEDDIRHLKGEIELNEGQLRNFENRLGKPFAHVDYMRQLSDFCDLLKLGLSGHPPEGLSPVAGLAEEIKILRE